ncbi:MAG TPA: PAS domain S-box protein, partial [Gemmatimonadaceae bacterium]
MQLEDREKRIAIATDMATPLATSRVGSAVDAASDPQADAVLRRQAAMLREGERLGKFGTWTLNLDEAVPTWSDGLYAVFGRDSRSLPLTTEELIETVHPDDRERIASAIAQSRARRNGTDRLRFRIVRPDGLVRTVEMRTYIEPPASNGRPTHFVGIVQDVTEEEASRAALLQSEERFRTAVEHSAIGIALTSPDGHFIKVNPALCRITGYDDDELLRMSFLDISHPDDVAADLALNTRLMAGEIPSYEIEKRYIHKQGHVSWVAITRAAVRGPSGRPSYAVTQVQEVTERRRMRETAAFLREAAHVLASSLESQEVLRILARLAVPRVADACFVDLVSDNGDLERVNTVAADPVKEQALQTIAARYGAKRWLPEHPVIQVLRRGEPLLLPTIDDDFLARGAVDQAHLDLLRSWQPRSGMVLPLKARGVLIGVISFYASESGVRYTQTDLELALDLASAAALAIDNARLFSQAKAAARTRDDVLGFIAHDLRDPIASITLWATKLKEEGEADTVSEKVADAILGSTDVMKTLIDDLVDVTRLEVGHLALSAEAIAPAALLATARDRLEALARQKGVRLEFEHVDLPRVQADPARVHQIVSNLISNAIRFTPRGGLVTLRAQAIGENVVFSVKDTGIGIPASQLGHVFDRFWQAAHARKGGSGLGLTIVKGLVEAHGGRVWAESDVGRGST